LINSNFLEDIGVDVDFFLNLGNAGYDPTVDAGGNPLTNPVYGNQLLTQRTNPGPWNRTTPITVGQNSFDWASPSATAVPGTLGGGGVPSAFSIAGSFLDNIQVDFLMRATQAHQRSRSLEAPHVTVFNGEEATVSFYTQQPYVSGLEAVTNSRVGLYTPEIDTTGTGITLIISPAISADKRYVILNVEVMQQKLLEIKTFIVNEPGAGAADVTADEEGNLETTTGSTASTGTLQQPVTQMNNIQTRVSVPDAGTLLLGGQKLTGEIEKEIGVPGLSKIPIIKRLFTNKSLVKDESVLLILIKPKIILQGEQEELRFGSLNGGIN
jgi:general secretion pathway protein D